jgi:hypothetical protein
MKLVPFRALLFVELPRTLLMGSWVHSPISLYTGAYPAGIMRVGERGLLVDQHSHIRWFNPIVEDFEWRQIPQSDEEALSLLEGSPYTPTCTHTYREWRDLGAGIAVALIRAGEAAKEKSAG